jgi:nucleoside-diphosphate-sugar epimerase
VYGYRQQVSDESLEPMPDSPYGGSKLAGEQVLRQWVAADPKRSVVVIRPTVVYGANNVANMYNLIRQIDSGLYFHIGEAANIKSIAYVENLVKATLFLKEKMVPGFHLYNYADEPQLTSKRIGDIIAQTLNKKIKLSIPLSLAMLLGLPFDAIIKLTGKNLPISSARIKKLNTETHHSARKIFQEGFTPQYSTIDGLKKMVAWYSQINKKD